MILEDIDIIRNALKNERAAKVKLLDKFIFGTECVRLNRNRILKFEGFSFNVSDDQYKTKVREIDQTFSLSELIKICDVLTISSEGAKTEVTEHILSCLCDLEFLKTQIIPDNNSEDEFEDVQKVDSSVQCENQIDENVNTSIPCENISVKSPIQKNDCSNVNNMKLSISFNDIEAVIPPFSGEMYENIVHWVENFENHSELLCLTDLHKLIFAKRSLRGNALLFVQSETKINSWNKLKDLLVSEFAVEHNSAQLHEILRNCKMKDSESLQQYFFTIKELCSRGNIEEAAVIQYVINGINDTVQNKAILHGSKTIFDFKEKLKVYDPKAD